MKCGFVAIVGWTNVGKSMLLNRLVGEKIAAVADVAQTTRNRIAGVRPVPGRGQIVFVDTPGLHQPKLRLNRAMVGATHKALGGVDIVLLVVDAAVGIGPGDASASALVRRAGVPAIVLLNKIDLVHPKSKLLPMMQVAVERWGAVEVIPVSALTGDGCAVLVERVLEMLPEGDPPFPDDVLTDQPERAIVAEWIREKILHHTREEIPHATAVLIDRWQERADGLIEIDAVVLVERDSQKAIVIGRQGRLMKIIGTEARTDIEKLLDARVMLRIRVEVRGDWRNDARTLRDMGLA